MEVAPALLAEPGDAERHLYVSTSGGAVSGTRASQSAPWRFGGQRRCRRRDRRPAAAGAAAADVVRCGAQRSAQCAGRRGTRRRLHRRLGLDPRRRPWCRWRPSASYGPRHHAAVDQPPGAVRRHHLLVQPAPGVSLSEATAAIQPTMAQINVPISIHGAVRGHGAHVPAIAVSQPCLILAAIVAIYIVLGMLYESYVHPLTILSTLPSAGVGAVLALLLFKTEFSLIAADRRDPADRHREEERDHDDRLRHRRRSARGLGSARRDLQGLPAALPADHDDDLRRHPGRAAAGDRLRRGANCASRWASPSSAG